MGKVGRVRILVFTSRGKRLFLGVWFFHEGMMRWMRRRKGEGDNLFLREIFLFASQPFFCPLLSPFCVRLFWHSRLLALFFYTFSLVDTLFFPIHPFFCCRPWLVAVGLFAALFRGFALVLGPAEPSRTTPCFSPTPNSM